MPDFAPIVRSRAMAYAMLVLLVVVVVLGVFWGGQRWALRRFVQALGRDDRAALAAIVDFKAVRAAVREQVLTEIRERSTKEVSLSEIDRAIQGSVTPDGLGNVLLWSGPPARLPTPDLLSLRKFRATFPGSADVTFCRVGVIEWDVCSLVLVPDGLLRVLGPDRKEGMALQRHEALVQILEIQNAVMQFMFSRRKCPKDVQSLVVENLVQPERVLDPWGNKVLIVCPATGEAVPEAISVGPDHLRGTADDVGPP